MSQSSYLNVILVPIEESQVVVLNGEEYLMVDPDTFQKVALTKKPTRPYTHTMEIQTAILKILAKKPKILNNVIRSYLKDEYNMEVSATVVRSLLQRLRVSGFVRSQGSTNRAFWLITPAGRRRLSDVK